MSNLWFFRLKRAEQQRRRSSGEQSTGSASVHSVTGVSVAAGSANSLPAFASEGQTINSCQLQVVGAEDDYREEDNSLKLESSRRKSASDGWRERRGERLVSLGEELHNPMLQEPQVVGQSYSNKCNQLPQVTIIRSDSTSSFIPMNCLASGDDQQTVTTTTTVQHHLVSKLSRDKSSVESQLETDMRPLHQEQQQQQQAVGIENRVLQNMNRTERGSNGSCELKRGLRDQLVSGKVPLIQERLLTPGGGPSLADSMDNLASLIPRVRVEFYNSENTLKEQLQLYFIKDHTVSLYVRTAKLILKVLACYLYVARVILDRGPTYANCYGCQSSGNATNFDSSNQQTLSKFDSYDGPINFKALFWVDRGAIIWSLQSTIAVICFVEAILMQYLTYKNSIFSIISFHFTLELVINTPFIISIFWKELRTLFVPAFLNCWLAKQCLEAMLNDLSIVRQSSVFSHRLTILSATVFCLIFTSACGFQHTQRSGGRNYITIFESIYFVVVTFSTVGYGDFKPETWPSQLFIMVMICVALIVLPTQFEQLAYFWIERKKLGASYAHHSTRHEKHVVVCSTTLRADTIMDFLNEFYAHPLLQTFSVVLLSPCELDTTMKLVLQTPTWNNRVVYIQGSALKGSDLIRARMQSAEACFILAARNYNDRSAADEHTILRSWAIRDFSPYVPQYVQIFRTENKIHVAFAEHVVCDDEFKYALLANNCLIPGTSTLVTLLLHTSQRRARRRRLGRGRGLLNCLGICSSNQAANGQQQNSSGTSKQRRKISASRSCSASTTNEPITNNNGQLQSSSEDEHDPGEPEWKRLYGKCSANEIYHIRLSDSRFFGEYQGKSFTYASFHSHRKFGVALIGVQTDMRGAWPIMLNPGPSYVLKSGDILFYINITKEENSTLMPMVHEEKKQQHFTTSLSGFNPTSFATTISPPDLSGSDKFNCSSHQKLSSDLDEQQQQQQSLGEPSSTTNTVIDLLGPAATTSIRVESSSPTIGQQDELENRSCQDEEMIMKGNEETIIGKQQQLQQKDSHENLKSHLSLGLNLPKKHSVADGASIVARSLCSVAGIPGVDLPQSCHYDSDHETSQRKPSENHLKHLGTSLHLGKRNSSASTSAAMNQASSGLGSRNVSTFELAALATGLRKGSNMSITSTKSRDVSPTRLKQVVSGLAVKMKRVKLGKSLTHLTIPRMDYGGSSASSTESFVNARGRRPSIAPVPAMMGESEEHDSDHEREQESYFAMSWQSNSESSPIVKKFVFCTTYIGVSPTLCYMLQRKKPSCCLQLVTACEHCPFRNARQYNWSNRCIILASDFASNGIYNFLVPLRAHFHNPTELRPIVLLLERKPSPQFIDAISWFPMVYWMPGSIDNLDDLIKAGINLAHSVVVTNKESTNSAEEDYLADCNTIVAVQTMFKMFPSLGIITELSQSSNMRFMQFRAHDLLLGGLSMSNYYQTPQQQQLSHFRMESSGIENGNPRASSGGDSSSAYAQGNAVRDRIHLRKLHSQYYSKSVGKDVNSHAYKYRLPFAAGNVFSASMLDTLLYQAFVKDYMITMVRLLLGIDQAPGSGFLSSMKITKEDLWIRTYGRLYQRLCSTTCEIPLGIYRTEPLEAQRHEHISFGAFASQQASYEHATEELERVEITNMVKNRLQDLGMLLSDYDDSPANRNNTFSYVIINPNCDIRLREGDIIYLIRPSPIHSRKLFMHRANSVRHTGEPPPTTTTILNQFAESDKQSAKLSTTDQNNLA